MDEEEEAMKRYKLKSNGSWVFYFIGVRTLFMVRWHHRMSELLLPNLLLLRRELMVHHCLFFFVFNTQRLSFRIKLPATNKIG